MEQEVNKRIEKYFYALREKNPLLLVIDDRKYPEVRKELLVRLADSYDQGLFVSCNSCASQVSQEIPYLFNKKNITLLLKETPSKIFAKNVLYLANPGSLTELSLTLNELLNNESYDYLYLDKVHEISFFNHFEATKRFIDFISNRLKKREVIFLATCLDDGATPEIVPRIKDSFKSSDLILSLLVIGGIVFVFIDTLM